MTRKRELGRHVVSYSALTLTLVAAILTLTFTSEIRGLLASATSSITYHPVTVFFAPHSDSRDVNVGDLSSVDMIISANEPMNAVGATIRFPTDIVEVVGFSKERSFLDLWTEETTIQESLGMIHFSGGTTHAGGMTGTGTVITLTLRAKKSGTAILSVEEVQVLAHDGRATPLSTRIRDYMLPIRDTSATSGGSSAQPLASKTAMIGDLDGNGSINLLDVSILAVRILLPYDVRFDLNIDGTVNLSDLSMLFAQL